MDSLITSASRHLANGDPISALNRVALRNDPPALALRGIAMAQMGEFDRARKLLRLAARAYGSNEQVSRARCLLAEAEVALASRDLAGPAKALETARTILEANRDRSNAAFARHLQVRRLVLFGDLRSAASLLESMDASALPSGLRASHSFLSAVIKMRSLRIDEARQAFVDALYFARQSNIYALATEIEQAAEQLDAPASNIQSGATIRLATLSDVADVFATTALIVDTFRRTIGISGKIISLRSRPVLFTLVRCLAEAAPGDVSRQVLLAKAFKTKASDDSHRARLRVEIGRLRSELRHVASVKATKSGFALSPLGPVPVIVLTPIVEAPHSDVLALLSDGEAWSSSALALALGSSVRSLQRALESLAEVGKVQTVGRGPSTRWMLPLASDFRSPLLLPNPVFKG